LVRILMKFSRREIRDLIKAWLAISAAFTIAFVGISFGTKFMLGLLVSAVTVGVGFLLHELAHKFVAQHYGKWAEFRSFDKMLILALIFSLFGFVFAAPGGVMIKGYVTKRKYGLIAVAGPITNIVLAALFLALGVFVPQSGVLVYYGALINAWLAVFNMIPFGPLDGGKVFRSNKVLYIIVLLLGIAMTFAAQRVAL